MPIMPKMRIQYDIREQDYYEAHQLTVKSLSRFNRPWLNYLIGGVMLFIAFIAMLLHLFKGVYIINLVLGPWFLVCPWLIRRRVRSIYLKAPNLHGTFVADFDEDGMSTNWALGEGRSKWAAFQKFAEGPNVFALITATRIFNIIPKRGLSDAELQSLRSLISAHLPNK